MNMTETKTQVAMKHVNRKQIITTPNPTLQSDHLKLFLHLVLLFFIILNNFPTLIFLFVSLNSNS